MKYIFLLVSSLFVLPVFAETVAVKCVTNVPKSSPLEHNLVFNLRSDSPFGSAIQQLDTKSAAFNEIGPKIAVNVYRESDISELGIQIKITPIEMNWFSVSGGSSVRYASSLFIVECEIAK